MLQNDVFLAYKDVCFFLLNCNTMLILFHLTIASVLLSCVFGGFGGCTIVHFDSASSVCVCFMFLNLLVIA